MREAFFRGVKGGIPIALGYFAVSFAFGIQAADGGIGALQAALISLMNVTSAGQLAGLKVIFAHGGLMEVALTQLVINLRYSLMSFSLSQKLQHETTLAQRCLVAFGVTDEIFAVAATEEGRLSPYFNYGAMSVAVPAWTLGTLCGALAGNVMPDILMRALSVAIYGMFLAIIIPPSRSDHRTALVVVSAMALGTVFAVAPVLKEISAGFAMIIITVAVAAVAAYVAPREDDGRS